MAQYNMTKLEFFSNVRINRLVQSLASQLEIAEPLTFLARTPFVNADDDEIVGRYSGPVFAADLITDDAEAVVVEGGRLETTGVTPGTIPNIKIGARVGQGMINRLRLLQRGIDLAGQSSLITGWENQLAQNLVMGVRQTQNYLCAAMMLDGVVYDRLGVKITAGFGTPSALKVTVGDLWTVPADATPIADIQHMLNVVGPSVGKTWNRIDIATPTLQKIFATDEFAERVRLYLRLEPTQFTLNPYDVANLKALLQAMTGVQFNEENTTFRVRNTNGTSTTQRVLPENKLLFSNTADDNNPAAYDFANGIVTETIVAPLIDGAPDLGGEQFGPVSYYRGNPELNPPDLRAWAVARGFPRKHDINAHAIMTVF